MTASTAGPRAPRVLHLEDDPADHELVASMLLAAGVKVALTRVDTRDEFEQQIEDLGLDLVIADYSLPSFDGLAALQLAAVRRPDLPFIILSGTLGEEVAIKCMRLGATDYVLKDNIRRIVPAVLRALEMAGERQQRALAERRLRDTLEILDGSPAVAFSWRDEPGWPVEHVSENVLQLVGVSAEELLSVGALYADLIHPEDRDRVETARHIETCPDQRTQRIMHRPYRLLHRHGGERWVDDRSAVHVAEDGIRSIHGIVIDISERQRAQAEVRRLTDLSEGILANINDGFGLFDEHDRWQFVNHVGAAMLGYRPDQLVGHMLTEVLPEDQRAVQVAAWERRRQGSSEHYELEFLHADGHRVPVQVSAAPYREQGRFVGTMAVMSDLTEQREAEAERRRLEEHLRQSQKMEALGTLAGGIAHDFNNILQVMLMSVELAGSNRLQGRGVDQRLAELRSSIARARRLVEQILTFSRRSEETWQPIRLQSLVKEALRMLREMVPSSIAITSQLSPQAPPVIADPTQVHQILMNLCTNAMHAIGGAPGTIEVSLDERVVESSTPVPGLDSGRYACLSVRDSGIGMSAATLERVFDPYFTTKEKGQERVSGWLWFTGSSASREARSMSTVRWE